MAKRMASDVDLRVLQPEPKRQRVLSAFAGRGIEQEPRLPMTMDASIGLGTILQFVAIECGMWLIGEDTREVAHALVLDYCGYAGMCEIHARESEAAMFIRGTGLFSLDALTLALNRYTHILRWNIVAYQPDAFALPSLGSFNVNVNVGRPRVVDRSPPVTTPLDALEAEIIDVSPLPQ
jgi:hypothetical protein